MSPRTFRTTLPLLLVAGVLALAAAPASACTAITLQGEDGSVIFGRTMEWATFNLEPGLVIVPPGTAMHSQPMPDGHAGAAWSAKYGLAGINLLGKPLFADAVNEKGLAVSLLYLPDFAEYQAYDPAQADISLSPGDLVAWIASRYATTAEVREAVAQVRVVPVVEPVLGFPPPVHYIVTDRDKNQIVLEYVGGELHIHDAPLGVLTNSPPYDWHMNNLRNYVNLRAVSWPEIKVADIDLKPIGNGSGMIGLPGDFTPPSRFVRAAAFSQTASQTPGGFDTARELFRILDNFNVPKRAVSGDALPPGTEPVCCSGTQYTTAVDLANLVIYYHTDTDRTVRKVDLGEIDFAALKEPIHQPLRIAEEHAIIDVTPGK